MFLLTCKNICQEYLLVCASWYWRYFSKMCQVLFISHCFKCYFLFFFMWQFLKLSRLMISCVFSVLLSSLHVVLRTIFLWFFFIYFHLFIWNLIYTFFEEKIINWTGWIKYHSFDMRLEKQILLQKICLSFSKIII